MHQREHLRALRVFAVDENEGSIIIHQAKPSALFHTQRPPGIVPHHAVKGNDNAFVLHDLDKVIDGVVHRMEIKGPVYGKAQFVMNSVAQKNGAVDIFVFPDKRQLVKVVIFQIVG